MITICRTGFSFSNTSHMHFFSKFIFAEREWEFQGKGRLTVKGRKTRKRQIKRYSGKKIKESKDNALINGWREKDI